MNARLRSRLVYIQPEQVTYDGLADAADTDLRTIRDEALVLIREALAARSAERTAVSSAVKESDDD